MDLRDKKILDILLQHRVVDEMQHRSIVAWHQQWGGRPHHVAVEQGFAREERVVSALAKGLNVPPLNLSERPPEGGALDRLSSDFCQEHGVLPIALRDGGKTLWLAMHDPTDMALIDQIRARARVVRVTAAVAGYQEILRAVKQYYRGGFFASAARFNEGIELDDSAEDSFKVTDIAGNTLVKHDQGVGRLQQELRQQPLGGGDDVFASSRGTGGFTEEQLGAAAPVGGSTLSFTSTPLEDLAGVAAPAAHDPAVLLRKIQANIDQTNLALRFVIEHCVQRGIFTVEEYQAKLGA